MSGITSTGPLSAVGSDEVESATKPMTHLQPLADAVALLELEGLNWLAYADASEGPSSPVVGPTQGVLLFLSMGSSFADRTRYTPNGGDDPFDRRALALVEPLLQFHLLRWDIAAHVVYPQQSSSINLLAWLAAAKAQYPSRLGIGVRPDCGTWFAVRAAIVTGLPMEVRDWLGQRYPRLPDAPSPCDTCVGRPCETACPVSAVGTAFDLTKCISQRLTHDSACAQGCAARSACPVGAEYRYSPSQMHYHYGVSLRMLRRWAGNT